MRFCVVFTGQRISRILELLNEYENELFTINVDNLADLSWRGNTGNLIMYRMQILDIT